MSSLSYLSAYGSDTNSSSSETEDSQGCKNLTRNKIPRPNLDRVVTVVEAKHSDDPSLHSGRIRSFPHVRGNWPSFVYIKCPESESILTLKERIALYLKEIAPVEEVDNIHVSLSKTVVLKYHMIVPFTNSLKEALDKTTSFDLHFEAIKVYCNEDKTRTFIALTVSNRVLLDILNKVDSVLEEFKLDKFYEEPSLHASIFWVQGDRKSELQETLEKFVNFKTVKSVFVNKIHCSIGNKQYQFHLE